MRKHVTVVIGGMAGSEGKGKVAGWLALHKGVTHAVCNFMPNAGHTWRQGDNKVMVQTLPQAVVNPKVELLISAGSAIQPDLFYKELGYMADDQKVYIHPRAMITTEAHRNKEANTTVKISSTCKGCGEATVEKIRRLNPHCLAKDYPQFEGYIDEDWYGHMDSILKDPYAHLLVEAPQGYDLDINHGIQYPYCTSRQTGAAQAIADAGIAPQEVTEVIAVIRPYPIRVGNNYDENGNMIGYSGDYGNSKELTWDEIGRRAGAPEGSFDGERTTVTNKIRRVFEPEFDRLKTMCQINGVTGLALNFADYISWDIKGINTEEQLTLPIRNFIDKLEKETGVPVVLVGTGPNDEDMIDMTYKL